MAGFDQGELFRQVIEAPNNPATLTLTIFWPGRSETEEWSEASELSEFMALAPFMMNGTATSFWDAGERRD